MKNKLTVLLASLVVLITEALFAQSNLNFIQVLGTSSHAVELHWNSQSNEIYEIDFADSIFDTNAGSIVWKPLYTDYPSHGTNTFIADAGNYDYAPEILHPALASNRFYRVLLVGTNTSPTNPVVAVTFPTNGTSLSGDVTMTVSASSSEILSEVNLYIDGELQWQSDDGTNFLINTCEWPNGPHQIYATAKSQSALERSFDSSITYGRSVSSRIPATFNNLISEFDFSEPFFEPSEGQTQKVTAAFVANVNWTLEVQNNSSNDVFSTNGSGSSMEFFWNGTGTNGVTIPDGVYNYILTVETNGLPPSSLTGGGGAGSPPGLNFHAQSFGEDDSGLSQPPSLPGIPDDQFYVRNDDVVVERKKRQNFSVNHFQEMQTSSSLLAYGSNNQQTKGPKRKPKVGVKNKIGSIGICYETYPFGAVSHEPPTGWTPPLPAFVSINGKSASSSTLLIWDPTLLFKGVSDSFSKLMKIGDYKTKFCYADEQWGAMDIKKASLGGSNLFNSCNFGLLLVHGCYGSTAEHDNVKYTYLYLSDQKHGSSFVKLSDMDFGSPGVNGLRWMTLFCCDMLNPTCITSMANHSSLPNNENLHLLLGFSTTTYASPEIGILYASNLVSGASIPDSLINSTRAQFSKYHEGVTDAIKVRVMGDDICRPDTLYIYNDPDPDSTYHITDDIVFSP